VVNKDFIVKNPGYFAESPQQRNQEFSCCTDALLHVGFYICNTVGRIIFTIIIVVVLYS